jgi:hypothetical protein
MRGFTADLDIERHRLKDTVGIQLRQVPREFSMGDSPVNTMVCSRAPVI